MGFIYRLVAVIGTFMLSSCLGYSAMALSDTPSVYLDRDLPEATEHFYWQASIPAAPAVQMYETMTDILEAKRQAAIAQRYAEPAYYAYSGSYAGNSFKSAGVVYEDGVRYTWYSQNVLPGGGLHELNANGRHVNDQGYICDANGYIAVASSDHEMGTVIDTPFGEAKVYDTGCDSGTVDVYTDF